jgi:hypothetical protein
MEPYRIATHLGNLPENVIQILVLIQKAHLMLVVEIL